METIINIIASAENSFVDWMIFVSAAAAIILAILGTWCWVGEKIINMCNLDDKFLEDE